MEINLYIIKEQTGMWYLYMQYIQSVCVLSTIPNTVALTLFIRATVLMHGLLNSPKNITCKYAVKNLNWFIYKYSVYLLYLSIYLNL